MKTVQQERPAQPPAEPETVVADFGLVLDNAGTVEIPLPFVMLPAKKVRWEVYDTIKPDQVEFNVVWDGTDRSKNDIDFGRKETLLIDVKNGQITDSNYGRHLLIQDVKGFDPQRPILN